MAVSANADSLNANVKEKKKKWGRRSWNEDLDPSELRIDNDDRLDPTRRLTGVCGYASSGSSRANLGRPTTACLLATLATLSDFWRQIIGSGIITIRKKKKCVKLATGRATKVNPENGITGTPSGARQDDFLPPDVQRLLKICEIRARAASLNVGFERSRRNLPGDERKNRKSDGGEQKELSVAALGMNISRGSHP